MERAHLKDYIRTARIVDQGPLQRGGGAHDKQLIVLDGGVGVIAKPAPTGDANMQLQVRAECAASILAEALGWPDLVPVTTIRVVPTLDGQEHVAASVQLALPMFKPAAELARDAKSCPPDEIWRVAIFDALALNTDRHNDNWGICEGSDTRPKLIDHGHSFEAATSTSFVFIDERRGETLPPELRERIDTHIVGPGLPPALFELLPATAVSRIVALARQFAEQGDFSL